MTPVQDLQKETKVTHIGRVMRQGPWSARRVEFETTALLNAATGERYCFDMSEQIEVHHDSWKDDDWRCMVRRSFWTQRGERLLSREACLRSAPEQFPESEW